MLRSVIDFAKRIDIKLSQWVEAEVAFPSTMVDRITPSPTQNTCQEAKRVINLKDCAAVETEEFSQWVIEDNFPLGRPDWDCAGAIFTNNVGSFEKMKLRCLTVLTQCSLMLFHCGHRYVRDVMNDKVLSNLVNRHLQIAAQTLKPIKGIDYNNYAQSLVSRFSNPEIAHETFQIAMDGSENATAYFLSSKDAISLNLNIRPFALQ